MSQSTEGEQKDPSAVVCIQTNNLNVSLEMKLDKIQKCDQEETTSAVRTPMMRSDKEKRHTVYISSGLCTDLWWPKFG